MTVRAFTGLQCCQETVTGSLHIIQDQIFLILYRELYYRHVYSRLSPDIDDRFHSYENSCELFNYLLSMFPSLFCSLAYPIQFELPRLRRPRPSRAPRAMAMGHHR